MSSSTPDDHGSPERLCAQEELDAMCRPGIELIHEAIDSGDPAAVRDTYVRVADARSGLVDLMNDWTATTLHYLLDEHGPEAMAGAMAPDLWLELGLRAGLTLDETAFARRAFQDSAELAGRLGEFVAAGDSAGAKSLWAEIDAATLKLHDYRIDWLTAVISHVYRAHGAQALHDALLKCARADWWHGRMVADLADVGDPVARVRNWTFFLGVGNWGTISATETDEAFVIHHQVCGSCGSQELRGRHEEPIGFPRVTEDMPALNFGDPNYTVYRTHLAVWHSVMPIPEVGHPWPAIKCLGVPGRCWFSIYKDPMDTPEWYYDRVGREKPGRGEGPA